MHERLLDCSKEKTEVIKEGSAEKLQALLAKEHQLIRLLEQTEQKRQELVENWFSQQRLPKTEERTITNMLEIIHRSDPELATKLESLTVDLTEKITELKNQEQLNRALIEQSMMFIQMSLNLLSPTIDQYNYGQSDNKVVDRSVFDSRA
mgnify:CR=1 FL=1